MCLVRDAELFFSPETNNTEEESSSGDEGVQLAIQQAAAAAAQQENSRSHQQTPPSPASGRKYQRCGHKLVLKKGRRSRHRCESERSLAVEVFGSADIPDEALEGWDIANPTR